MNKIFLTLIVTPLLHAAYGQDTTKIENRRLIFDSTDLKIIQRADAILTDSTKWNKNDDRACQDDTSTGHYSLYCALYKASIEIAGEYVHRRAALQIVRFTLEKYDNGRVKEHRLMDWNNHANTSFAELKKVLHESLQIVQKQLSDSKRIP